MRGRAPAFRLALAAALAFGCSDGATGPDNGGPVSALRYPTLPGLIVSDAAAASTASSSGTAGSAADVAWISLPPGTLSNVASVRILRASDNAALTMSIALVDGGFDPVPVTAHGGDEIFIEMTSPDGAISLASMRVPPRRPPGIVRTSPPSGRTDVALSVRPAVIFSEPIDPSTLAASPIVLVVDGETVPGVLVVPPGQPWLVEFVPDAELLPGMTYEIAITRAVRDLQGDALEAETLVRFTTRGSPDGLDIAFVSNRTGEPWIYLTDRAGTTVRALTRGESPSWSRDGSRIAFHRTTSNALAVYTINADGSNERLIRSNARSPSWSPDNRIAYTSGWKNGAGGGVSIMDEDGSNAHLVLAHDFADTESDDYYDGLIQNPAWSPDGLRLTFERAAYATPWLTWVIGAGGAALHVLNPDGWQTIDPVWSPDGLWITVVGGVGSITYPALIADYAADGSGVYRQHVLPLAPQGVSSRVGSPDWAPDGSAIVYEQQIARPVIGLLRSRSRIFLFDVATGVTRRLVADVPSPTFAEYADYDAAWAREH